MEYDYLCQRYVWWCLSMSYMMLYHIYDCYTMTLSIDMTLWSNSMITMSCYDIIVYIIKYISCDDIYVRVYMIYD